MSRSSAIEQDLLDAVHVVLAQQPGRSAEDIFDELFEYERRLARRSSAIEQLLRDYPDRFAQYEPGRWSLLDPDRPAPAPVEPTPPELTAPVPTPPEATSEPIDVGVTAGRGSDHLRPVPDPSAGAGQARTALPGLGRVDWDELEADLRERLRGRRLVAEIGIGADTLEDCERALEGLLRTNGGDLERAARNYPHLMVTYLVAHGVYEYSAGSFWKSATLPGAGVRLGQQAVKELLPKMGMETFQDLVAGDNAQPYVGPLLAHGGIPKYCLDDFFGLVERDMTAAGGDAQELLAHWRARRTSFLNIDVPVRRFLLYGGPLAVDLLDRVLDLIRAYQDTGMVLKPDEIGLPPYIVLGFKRNAEHFARRPGAATTTRRIRRAQVVFDPWSPLGIEVVLPPVPHSLEGAFWRVSGGDEVRRVDASHYEERSLALARSKAWTVELHHGIRTELSQQFEGFGDYPALFFDPDNGNLLVPASGLRRESVVVLTPEGGSVLGIDTDGTQVAPHLVEELPALTGAWSSYQARHIALDGLRLLDVAEQAETAPDRAGRRVSVQPPAERPQLVTEPVPSVSTSEGLPVFDRVPVLSVPVLGELQASQWMVRISVDGQVHRVSLADMPPTEGGFDLSGLVRQTHVPIHLVVQGSLGSDLRTSFVVVPGLQISRPERLIFPGDPTGSVRAVLADGTVVTEAVPERSDEVPVVVGNATTQECALVVRVARVMWAVTDDSGRFSTMAPDRLHIVDADIERGVAALAVRTGDRDHPLQLVLRAGNENLQRTDIVRPGRQEGRWIFDLARFADNVRQSDAAAFELTLDVGARPVTVATIGRTLDIRRLEAHSRVAADAVFVHIEMDMRRAVQGRVLRFWPLDRVWAPPHAVALPDDTTDAFDVDADVEQLPPGRYLVQLALDDGWSRPRFPGIGEPGTTVLAVGTRADAERWLEARPVDDPIVALERTILDKRISRRFEAWELSLVRRPALLTIVHRLREHGARAFADPVVLTLRLLLLADGDALAGAVVEVLEDEEASTAELTKVFIGLLACGDRVAPPPTDDRLIRSLWDALPLAAAIIDLQPGRFSGPAGDRALEFLGWDPVEGVEALDVAPAINQREIGLEADQLASIQRHLDLIPRRLLSEDNRISGSFEWIINAKSGCFDAPAWFHQHRRLQPPIEQLDEITRAHLDARAARPGTEPWAAIPQLILGAALDLLLRRDRAPEAARLLIDAVDFAPRQVARDLALAHVLLVSSANRPRPDLTTSDTPSEHRESP